MWKYFHKLALVWGGRSNASWRNCYLYILCFLTIILSSCVETCCYVFKSLHQQQEVGSGITDEWGKDIVSTLRQEGITRGPSWKESGKAKEVCQIEIGKDEDRRCIHCCVLPSAVPCLPAGASPFSWCYIWKCVVKSGETLYYYWNRVLCVTNSISAAEFKIKPPHIECISNSFLFLN